MILTNIFFTIHALFEWFPINNFKNIQVAIHSPNNLPDANAFKTINTGKLTNIGFNQLTTKHLGEGYEHNCYEYDLDYKFANFNMRSDCIQSCIQNSIKNICELDDLILFKGLYRIDLLESEPLRDKKFNMQNNSCQKNNFKFSQSKCLDKCENDCEFKFYSLSFTEEKGRESKVDILIKHNESPDVFIHYIPKTTLLLSFCNFAGLLGMWLGFSIFNFFQIIISTYNKLFLRQNLIEVPRRRRRYFIIHNGQILRTQFNNYIVDGTEF